MNRRDYIKKTFGGAALLGAAGMFNSLEAGNANSALSSLSGGVSDSLLTHNLVDDHGMYTLADLPYAHDALEPHIDAQTMQLHHSAHHQGYVNGLNNALAKLKESRENNDFSLVKHWSREVSFNGGGHYLHTLFWTVMSPNGGGEPRNAALKAQIDRDFGSYNGFLSHFLAASNGVEGGGWGVLAWEPVGRRLIIHQVEKQQDLSTWSNIPLLMVDVWEHAYYLKYQNRRGAYTQAFMNVVDWDEVARRFDVALKFG
jgi:superoxide dismutase, Fe-Mn family